MKQFGRKIEGVDYIDRPGAYAIILDEQHRVAVVESGRYCFLPGGGLEGDETPEEALHREVLEETGWTIRIGTEVGRAGEYLDVPSEGQSFNKVGHFYLAEIVERSETESVAYPPALWLFVGEFALRAAHESQVWAAERALDIALKRNEA